MTRSAGALAGSGRAGRSAGVPRGDPGRWALGTVMGQRIAEARRAAAGVGRAPASSTGPGHAKILATTYFPERLPSQYLRRWRA